MCHLPSIPTIQSAVDACGDDDTVLVADDTYTGADNRDIDFKGKNITATSQNGPTKTGSGTHLAV